MLQVIVRKMQKMEIRMAKLETVFMMEDVFGMFALNGKVQ
jgi:hypothetical protein